MMCTHAHMYIYQSTYSVVRMYSSSMLKLKCVLHVWSVCSSIPHKSIHQIDMFFCRSKCWTTPAFHFQRISLLVIALAIHFTIWILSARQSHFSRFVHDSTRTIVIGIESKRIPLIESIGCMRWFPALKRRITGPQWLGGKSGGGWSDSINTTVGNLFGRISGWIGSIFGGCQRWCWLHSKMCWVGTNAKEVEKE